MEENGALSSNEESAVPVPESPKPMAFTIDFGEGKSIDSQRHKNLVEKYQKRHRRGQSLSKLDDSPTSNVNKKHPLSANLPRKALQTEGYCSSDEKGKNVRCINNVKLRDSLSLPLKNMNSDKMTQSCTLPSIESPNIELRDVLTPELDLVSPFSPQTEIHSTPVYENTISYRQLSSPESEARKSPEDEGQFIDGAEFDFDKSDVVSDTGTYTLDPDNYSEEQKARMSIDREFKIEQVSVYTKTKEYVESLTTTTTVKKRMELKKPNNVEECLQKPDTLPFMHNNTQRCKNKLSPIVSPTQNLSIIQNTEQPVAKPLREEYTKTFTKIMFPSPKAKIGIGLEKQQDQGSIISVTCSGAFRSKTERERLQLRKLSLSKSEVHVEAYTDNTCITTEICKPENKPRTNLSANLVLVSENLPKAVNNDKFRNGGDKIIDLESMQTNVPVGKIVNLPPPVGGISGKFSPTKIPSPIHTSRPRSRNSSNSLNIDLSDSSLETESYLKPTQNLLNSLQQRLSLDSDHDSDNETKYLNNDARNLLKKPTHMRHNSLDDRNLKISNKLEHFQNKNLIDQTYSNMLNQYSHSKIHKIQNSPNNSPIRRSSSFSTKNQINTKCSNIMQKDINLQNSPNFTRNGSIQRSSSTASIRPNLLNRRPSITSDHRIDRSQYGDTESSSEEDIKISAKKKDITNTRYNRAFSLRRARLDDPIPPPKCPNTPEMRRKFQPSDPRAERAISVDRRPMKSTDIQSRYLLNIAKNKVSAVQSKADVKGSPKIGNVVTKPSPKPAIFSRTDSGRFSMRTVTKPAMTNSQKTIRKEISSGKKPSGPRSNSSLTSKEVEFQNWKRRKSYDPMKAAAEGKRKAEMAKKQSHCPMTQSYHEGNQDCDSSPSHSSSVHRSQSFHGTAALEQYISSEEEDLTLSADEGFSPPTPSPCNLSPSRVQLRYAWKDQLLH